MPFLTLRVFRCAIAVAICVPVVATQTAAGDKPSDKPMVITMKSMSFEPKRLEMPVGASVVWANKSHSKHTATSNDDGKKFDTGEIKPGNSSKPVKFKNKGEFKYHCLVHGKSMIGTVVVVAAGKR